MVMEAMHGVAIYASFVIVNWFLLRRVSFSKQIHVKLQMF